MAREAVGNPVTTTINCINGNDNYH